MSNAVGETGKGEGFLRARSPAGDGEESSVRTESLSLYLTGSAEPVFAMLQRSSGEPASRGVLLCPPFGWEEICSYRSRHEWALRLAAAGYPNMRIDLPGTGDSAGDAHDPDRVGAWSAAIAQAAEQLRILTGAGTVAAVGISLGGLLLWKAICEGAPIEEAVMWGVQDRGRSLIRELRAFARLEDLGAEDAGNGSSAQQRLLAGGFVLSEETVQAIEALDFTKMSPEHPLRRVLLLDRDGMAPDERLRSHLAANATDFALQPGPGYGSMMAKPELARAPVSVFATVERWLGAGQGGEPGWARRADVPHTIAPGDEEITGVARKIQLDTGICESTLTVPQPFGNLFGVLSRPTGGSDGDLCAVLLNAGAIRRVGPNRMWVEAARRWAAQGIPTLRLDLEGIGDADGDGERFDDIAEFYVDSLVIQARAAIDALQAQGFGPNFVLGGLCSGAYWSFHTALEDPRVVGAMLLNPRALYWDASLETARDLRRGLLRTSSWRKALRGEIPSARLAEAAARAPAAPLELARRAIARSRARRSGVDKLEVAFDRLQESHKPVLFLFSGNEPLLEELEHDGYLDRLERWPSIEMQILPGADHTLRPLQAQRQAHEAMDLTISRIAQDLAAI